MSEQLVDLDYDGVRLDKPDNNAIVIEFIADEDSRWVPRSLIADHDEEARVITVPEWWAKQEGLV